MKIPILTYRSYQAGSPRDILSFEEHLRIISREGFVILSLRAIVDRLVEGKTLPERSVGISCDDGKQYDFLPEPTTGKSMLSVLTDFIRRHPIRQRRAELSCFVIADSRARTQIGLGDPDLLGSFWWRPAAASGRISIQNHGLDHVHERVTRSVGLPPYCNDFSKVDTLAEADAQIALAARIIDHHVERQTCSLFAYPFGQTNDFLVREYFPDHGDRHGMLAAFTTDPEPLTLSSNRWTIPRYVANHHIQTDADLIGVLHDCRRTVA